MSGDGRSGATLTRRADQLQLLQRGGAQLGTVFSGNNLAIAASLVGAAGLLCLPHRSFLSFFFISPPPTPTPLTPPPPTPPLAHCDKASFQTF